jgi:hypothetical protein
MNLHWIEPLWSQQGIGGIIILLLFVIAHILKAFFESRSAKASEEKLKQKSGNEPAIDADDDFFTFQTKTPPPPRERKRSPRRQPSVPNNETTFENPRRKTRGTLSRELGQQGEGTRFEAAPGTFDPTQLVAPTIEPTVKPTLESMTGIYEAPPTSNETQPSTLNILQFIMEPEGIRQAIILAEILKRPEYQ